MKSIQREDWLLLALLAKPARGLLRLRGWGVNGWQLGSLPNGRSGSRGKKYASTAKNRIRMLARKDLRSFPRVCRSLPEFAAMLKLKHLQSLPEIAGDCPFARFGEAWSEGVRGRREISRFEKG